jgi:23S rRNA (adenine2503-C2)-methyltransferase
MTGKEKLYGKTLAEIQAIVSAEGMPAYAAKQITGWLYPRGVSEIKNMTDLSLKSRLCLEERYELGIEPPVAENASLDGTKKYLFSLSENRYIETAFIPDEERATICVSSQSGCRMGCRFCMTARQGFQGNLTSNEILNQFRSIPEHSRLTNMVYMGMGEPFDNLDEVLKSLEVMTSPWGYGWSPTRITVSTVGIVDKMQTFLEATKCHLAVSLHSPFDNERQSMMPVQKAHPVKEVLDIIRSFDFSGQRRVSFEYIVFRGMNDTPAHIKELARILNGIRCRVNLIRFHNIPGSEFSSPDQPEMIRFRDALNDKGIIATIRASRGEDINAACGLLSTLKQNKGYA